MIFIEPSGPPRIVRQRAGDAVDPNEKKAWAASPLANTGRSRPDPVPGRTRGIQESITRSRVERAGHGSRRPKGRRELISCLAAREAGVCGFDASGSVLHLVGNRVAQRIGGQDDAGRAEGEQERVLDRRNTALVGPKIVQKLNHYLNLP